MTGTQQEIAAFAFVITVFVFGHWLFGSPYCSACEGTGERNDEACDKCKGSGKR